MGTEVDGVWTYTDPEQNQIVAMAHTCLQWDLAAFDAWLYGKACWRNFPKVRQTLMGLRGQLTFALRAGPLPDHAAQRILQDYFFEVCRLASPLKNLPAPLKHTLRKTKASVWPVPGVKLDAASIRRIQRAYQHLRDHGDGYGAMQQLAEQHAVSVTTIRRVLNRKTAALEPTGEM